MSKSKQLMNFKIEDNKLKMEIKIKDLVFLFKTSPQNYDGETMIAKIKKDKEIEFVNFIIDFLQEPNRDENITNWGAMIECAFEEILDGDEEFCKYNY